MGFFFFWKYQSGETAEEGEPKVAERERKVFVEKVAEEFGHSKVGPAAVDQEEPLQVAELRDAVIRRQDGLQQQVIKYIK